MSRKIIFTKNATLKLLGYRKGKTISRNAIEALIKNFDQKFDSFTGKTAVPFIFKRMKCHVLIQAEIECIFI
ncbi:MAG: hypothetical protein JRJ62_08355 [Deltaproteobacteria bacterium]|nr:hypothetical protein [Deltaproteobacteria bacterium]